MIVEALIAAALAVDSDVDRDYKKARAAAVAQAPGAKRAQMFEQLADHEARLHDLAGNYRGAEAWAWVNAANEWMQLGVQKEAAKQDAVDVLAAFTNALYDYHNALQCETVPADAKSITQRNLERIAKRGIKAKTRPD